MANLQDQDRPRSTVKPAFWRRGRYQVLAIALALLTASALAVNLYLSRQYEPSSAVSQYLTAIENGNATSALSASEINAPAGGAPVGLTTPEALRAALVAGRPDIKTFDISGTHYLDSDQTVANVDVLYESSAGVRRTTFGVERGADRHLGIYPVWRVRIQSADLTLTGVGDGSISIDGKAITLPPGTSQVAVWPVAHRVLFHGTAMLASQAVEIDSFATQAQTVSFQPSLTPEGEATAKASVKAAFAACASQTSLHPDGCPQRYDDRFTSNGSWRLVGDPTQDLQLAFDSSMNLIGSGHYQMVAAYEDSSQGTLHSPSAGGYVAKLAFGTSDATVASIGAADGLPTLSRAAAATDQAVDAVVAKAMAACTAARTNAPPDCPQDFYFPDATNVSWSSGGDPLAGSTVSFDGTTGIFTVHDSFQMTASYQLNGYSDTRSSSTVAYEALLLWDGQGLQLVTISGSYS